MKNSIIDSSYWRYDGSVGIVDARHRFGTAIRFTGDGEERIRFPDKPIRSSRRCSDFNAAPLYFFYVQALLFNVTHRESESVRNSETQKTVKARDSLTLANSNAVTRIVKYSTVRWSRRRNGRSGALASRGCRESIRKIRDRST